MVLSAHWIACCKPCGAFSNFGPVIVAKLCPVNYFYSVACFCRVILLPSPDYFPLPPGLQIMRTDIPAIQKGPFMPFTYLEPVFSEPEK